MFWSTTLRKFVGKNKLERAKSFIADRAEVGQYWEIAENHGDATVVVRRKCRE